MKDFLIVLFYQAVVAVNTAVILSGIIWLAKRKENQKKTPNPDSTPPPEKKPPTPPTTGSCAVKPKGTCFYTLEVREGPGNPVVATFSAKSEEELKKQIEKLKAEPIAVYNSAEEAGFETEYLNAKCEECGNWKRDSQIFGHCTLRRCPVKAYERRRCQSFKKWEPKPKTALEDMCRNCKHFLTTDDEATVGECGLNDEIVFKDESRGCFEPKEKKSEPSCADCRWLVTWRDGDTVCANTGLSVYEGLSGAHCEYFERKPGESIVRPRRAEPQPQEE